MADVQHFSALSTTCHNLRLRRLELWSISRVRQRSGKCLDAGPFNTYDLVEPTIQSELVKADTDPQTEGWRANGNRARLI